MANFQLSVSSPAAPRHRIPQQTHRKARRNLFGSVHHEELNCDLDAKLSGISEREQQRWNFNFVSGTPLHGDYKWERAAVDTTPAFYLKSGSGGKKTTALPHTEPPNGVNCARGSAASGAVSSTRTGKPSCTKRKTNARVITSSSSSSTTTTTDLTEFYIKRKKPGGVKQREGAPVNPLIFLSSEQTPRKGLR
ncbi:Cyclin-dependent kinase inhibitor 1 [Bagarius yarrelli]|uniref:Cyclin-dependent kinase inhibitor 1 n=1 Tax=Bagarius yarrelli TaxID=175774 RepID=A0A556U4X8_BAGYA|nr:Cyclin-dependent kinase inhibitor 1 [Bagarius yarrelli]